MKTLEQLQEKKAAIAQRWFECALATYPKESCAAFDREMDPFANPVGHTLRVGTLGIVEALFDGMDADRIREHLREIIRIRAVQQFTPSQAIGFVFHLKDAIRTELGKTGGDVRLSAELEELERQIHEIVLWAFDIFVECREQVYELRINEAKRRVSWVMDRLNKRGSDPELTQIGPG